MGKEAENEKLTTLGIKVNLSIKDRFDELKTDGSFDTNGQFLECLLERYANPLKINKENEEKLRASSDAIIGLRNSLDAALKEVEELKTRIAEKDTTISELRTSLDGKNLSENQHILSIDPLYWRILQTVAEREGKRRKQEWTPDDVVNYFIHTRFELGTLNGDLNSLPDDIIRELKKEMEASCSE